jgi:DNA helicase II / ATP-dependent DNA helicase PcrA
MRQLGLLMRSGPSKQDGALHDKRGGATRGLAFSDIAVLVRSSTSLRAYMRALESAGVPCIVRAGPDLFSQPEVLLVLGALGVTSGQDEFIGSEFNPKSMPNRIDEALGCNPKPEEVLKASARLLRQSGLAFDRNAEDRLLLAAEAIRRRVSEGYSYSPAQVACHARSAGLSHFQKHDPAGLPAAAVSFLAF